MLDPELALALFVAPVLLDAAFDASPRDLRARLDAADLVRAATAAERQRLTALRADGTIGDAAFQRVEQELDLEELDLWQLLRSEPAG